MSKIRHHRHIILLIVISVCINLALLTFYYWDNGSKQLLGDEVYYQQLALQYANGENAYPNLLWPNLQAEWMSIVYRIFGEGLLAIQLIQIILWLLTGVIVYRIALSIKATSQYAIYALALMLLNPELMAFSHYLWAETIHLFFFCVMLWGLICHPRNIIIVTISGISLGLGLLSKLLLIPFIPISLALYIFLNRQYLFWKTIGLIAIFLCSMYLTIAPTIERNREQFNAPMIADSTLFNIWVGLNDTGKTEHESEIVGEMFQDYMELGNTHQERNQVVKAEIELFMQSSDILSIGMHQLSKQYFRLFYYESFFLKQLPYQSAPSYPDFPIIWVGLIAIYVIGFYICSWLCAIYGLATMSFETIDWRLLFVLFLLYNLAIFFVIHSKPRYVIQLYPTVAIFGAVGIARLINIFKQYSVASFGWSLNKLRILIMLILIIFFLTFTFHPNIL